MQPQNITQAWFAQNPYQPPKIGAMSGSYVGPRPGTQAPATVEPKKKGNFLTNLLPTAGGIGGGVAGGAAGGALAGTAILPGVGTAVGGLAGALIGGFTGGAAGKAVENKIEGNAIGNGVLGSGVEQGVLSAGPLRLLKGAKAVAGVAKPGVSLAEALANANTKVAEPNIIKRTATGLADKYGVGAKLQNGSDQLATHALKLNGSQFNTTFANKSGEEVGQFATRMGLVGKSPQEIKTLLQDPGQKLYAQGVASIGTVPKSDVIATIKNDLADKIKSPFAEDRVFANGVIRQANAILRPFGRDIPATELNNLKTAAYKKVNNKFTDKVGIDNNSLYDTLSNSFRNAVGNAADKAGLTIDPAVLKAAGLPFKSTKLSDFGHELRNLDEITKQIDVKSRVGAGKNILGLGGIGGLTAGGVLGGPIGAGVGIAGQAALKNPKVLAAGTNLLDTAGQKLASGGAGMATQAFKPRVALPAAAGLAGALMNANQPDISLGNNKQSTMMNSISNNPDSMDTSYTNGADVSSALGNNPYPLEALNRDVAADPKNAAKYFDLYQNYQKAYASGDKTTFNSAIAGHISDTQKGLQTLDQLKQLVQSPDYSGGVVQGNIRKYNPFDNTFKSQQAVIDASRQIVGKALEGGVLRKEDETKYLKILPTLQDSPEVALSKINFIQQSIEQALQQYQGLVGDGSGQDDLSSALMQAGYSGR